MEQEMMKAFHMAFYMEIIEIGMSEKCSPGFEKVSERPENVMMVRVYSRHSTIGSGFTADVI